MEKLTYKQAYDKIIEAYFKDEIKPYNGEFCFCGTIAPWTNYSEHWSERNYCLGELSQMEEALLVPIMKKTLGGRDKYFGRLDDNRTEVSNHPNYEDALFSGMCAALDVLKEIHRSRGEDVDELPILTKRQLAV